MDTLNILEQPGTFLNRFLNFTVLSPLTMEYGLISLECCTSQGDLQIEKGRNRLNRNRKTPLQFQDFGRRRLITALATSYSPDEVAGELEQLISASATLAAWA